MATFKACPRKWYIQKILQIKDTKGQSPATVRGQAVHYALEQYAQHRILPQVSLVEWFETAPAYNADFERGGRVYANPTRDELREQSVNIANAMLLHVNPDDPGQVELEFSLDTTEDLPPVLGFIDVYHPKQGVIRDWKVRSNAKKYGLKSDELAQDIQMNVYARVYFQDHPEATQCVVEHVYADPNTLANFAVQATIQREENEKYWENLLDIIDLMMLCSKAEEEEIPTVNESCGQYGGCSYRDRCFPPNIFAGFEDMTTSDQALERLRQVRAEGGLGVNPPAPAMPNLHTRFALLSLEALNALCGLWYQQRESTGVDVDMRGRPATQQCAFLTTTAARCGWTLEQLEPLFTQMNELYPHKEVDEPKPMTVRSVPLDEDTARAVTKKRNGLRTPMRKYLVDKFKVHGMRSWIADDRETPLTAEYAQMQVYCRANNCAEATQGRLLTTLVAELEARGATAENYIELLERPRQERLKTGAMPVNVTEIPVASWEDVFLMLTTTACRRVPAEYASQIDLLLKKHFIAEHPQQPEYYYVTSPGEWNALMEMRTKQMHEAAQHVAEVAEREAEPVQNTYYIEHTGLATGEDVSQFLAEAIREVQQPRPDRKTQLWAQAQEIMRQQKSLSDELAVVMSELGVLP